MGLANKAAQNRLPGFRVLSQFFLQSISRCAILLYTDHKKHPVFLLRIVSFYRCDPRPSRGLQLTIPQRISAGPIKDAIRAPHGDCNYYLQELLLLLQKDAIRAPHGDCNEMTSYPLPRTNSQMRPAPLTGTATKIHCSCNFVCRDATRTPHGDCNKKLEIRSWLFKDATRAPHGVSIIHLNMLSSTTKRPDAELFCIRAFCCALPGFELQRFFLKTIQVAVNGVYSAVITGKCMLS